MDEEHKDEMLRFQVSGEWVFKFQFQGNGFFFSVSRGMGFQFQGNGFSVLGKWVSSWILGKNTRMKTTRAIGKEHDLGLFGDFR